MPRWATSLTAKYAAVFALLAAVPLAATSAYLLDSSYNRSRSELIRLQQEKAKSLALILQQTLLEHADRLESLHLTGFPDTQRQLLLRPFLLTPNVYAVSYVDGEGRELVKVRKGGGATLAPSILSHQPFFVGTRNGRAYVGPITVGASARPGRPRMAGRDRDSRSSEGCRPRSPSGRPSFRDLVVNTHLGRSGYAFVVDAKGATDSAPQYSGRPDFSGTCLAVKTLPQVAAAGDSGTPSGSATGRNFSRTAVLSAWATVPASGWKVFVEQPQSEVFAPLRGTVWRTVLLLLAFVAGAVALAVLLAQRLVRPIKRFQVAAAAIGAGAYAERIELDRRDELGDLLTPSTGWRRASRS